MKLQVQMDKKEGLIGCIMHEMDKQTSPFYTELSWIIHFIEKVQSVNMLEKLRWQFSTPFNTEDLNNFQFKSFILQTDDECGNILQHTYVCDEWLSHGTVFKHSISPRLREAMLWLHSVIKSGFGIWHWCVIIAITSIPKFRVNIVIYIWCKMRRKYFGNRWKMLFLSIFFLWFVS